MIYWKMNLAQLMGIKMLILLSAELMFCRYIPRRDHFWPRLIGSGILCIAIAFVVPIDFPNQLISGTIIFLFHMLLSMLWLFFCFKIDMNTILFIVSEGKVCTMMASIMEKPLAILLPGKFALDSIFTARGLMFYGKALFGVAVIFPIIYLLFARKYKRINSSRKCSPVLWMIFIMIFIVDIVMYFMFSAYMEQGDNPLNTIGQVMYYCIELFMHIFVIFLLNTIYQNSEIKTELDSVNALWARSKTHYDITKDTIDAINRKCHDLKHRVMELQNCNSQVDFDDIYRAIDFYDSRVKTGNEVLDVILAEKNLICADKKIHIECMADGRGLNFMDKTDLFVLFGNIMDNCIEAVEKFEDQEKFILINVMTREGFVIINTTNPYKGQIKWRDYLPETSKGDNSNHGFGMISIDTIIRR